MIEIRVEIRNKTDKRFRINVFLGHKFFAYENFDGSRNIGEELPELLVIEIEEVRE